MKKTLLSVLLCGFVLNNGYCFDGEHKITEENVTTIIKLMEKRRYLKSLHELVRIACWKVPESFGVRSDTYDSIHYKFDESVNEVFRKEDGEIESQICGYLREFGKEVLLSIIPSEKQPGKDVDDLLRCGQLYDGMLQMICDNSVKFKIEGPRNFDKGSITFFFNCGAKIIVREIWSDEYSAELHDPSLGVFESGIPFQSSGLKEKSNDKK